MVFHGYLRFFSTNNRANQLINYKIRVFRQETCGRAACHNRVLGIIMVQSQLRVTTQAQAETDAQRRIRGDVTKQV